jgi:rhamnosyltransferase
MRIRSVVGLVDRCAVVDNSADLAITARLGALQQEMRFDLIQNPRNLGLATALNLGLEVARKHHFKWALLFDQDSEPNEAMLEQFAAIVATYDLQKPLAVVGSNYPIAAARQSRRSTDKTPWFEDRTAITSGSLVSIAAVDRVGPFDEAFFIDHVDHEFCLRCRARGFAVVNSKAPLIRHVIGNPESRRFLGREVVAMRHSALRRYYMSRNGVVLARRFVLREPVWVFKLALRGVGGIVKIALYEHSRYAKIQAIIRGFLAGLCGRLGPAPRP